MQQLLLCAVGLTLSPLIPFAQPPTGRGPGPVLGIVEIPEMFIVEAGHTGRWAPRTTLTLYTRPDSESDVTAVISSPEAIDDAEYGYEEVGALVYGRERGYFLIRTSRGVGWLAAGHAGRFHPLEMLLTKGLTYLTDAWDGFVSASPASATRTRIPPRKPQRPQDVRVKGLRTVAGRLWVDIEVMSHSFCESQAPPRVKARGWIAAHDKTGAPTVWFFSRGC